MKDWSDERMKMTLGRISCAVILAFAVCFAPVPAAVDDYVTLKLKDGREVEGRVIADDPAKIVVEYRLRGIARQETVYRHTISDFHVLSPAELEQRAKAAVSPPPAAVPSPIAIATRPASPQPVASTGGAAGRADGANSAANRPASAATAGPGPVLGGGAVARS